MERKKIHKISMKGNNKKVWFEYNDVSFYCYEKDIFDPVFSKELGKIKDIFMSKPYYHWSEGLEEKDIFEIFSNNIFFSNDFVDKTKSLLENPNNDLEEAMRIAKEKAGKVIK